MILLIDLVDYDHEAPPKYFLKHLCALLNALNFYLTLMCGVDMQGDTAGIRWGVAMPARRGRYDRGPDAGQAQEDTQDPYDVLSTCVERSEGSFLRGRALRW